MGTHRRYHHTLFCIALAALIIASAIGPLQVEADEQSLDWLGSEAPSRPEVNPNTNAPDSERGRSSTFAPGPDRATAQTSEDDDVADYQRIFPPDDRVRISPTTSFPASAVALIENWIGGTLVSTCSGTFIGPDVVLTAGHCLYTEDYGWSSSVSVIPAKDGYREPYGYEWASQGWVPGAWEYNLDPEWDWGLLKLPNSSLGNSVGWFQIGALTTDTLRDPNFQPAMLGYPGDKAYGTMWMTANQAFLEVGPTLLANRLDSVSGQSGSAVWRGSDALIVGIQIAEIPGANIASRIDLQLLDDLLTGCAAMSCEFSFVIEEPAEPEPPPPPAPEPEPSPEPDQSAPAFAAGPEASAASDAFENTRGRTDHPVETGRSSRTWMWGPQSNSAPIEEAYSDAPGGSRVVQYFDKSRMEDNAYRASAPWDVTNGLLVLELITGRLQLGDDQFEQRNPARVQVAGDDHPDSPTYATLDSLRSWDPVPTGSTHTQRLHPDGSVSDDPALARHGATAARHVRETNHAVASVFWDFMTASGTVYENGQFTSASLFENPFFATGFPITEAYWVNVPVGGEHKDVLLQCFQRRCLTYTPDNPSGWQVEAGNVGQHYYRWRYGDAPAFP